MNKKTGFTLLEVLISLLLLILVMLGFLKAVTEFQIQMKQNNFINRVKELAQQIKGKILSTPYTTVKNCFPPAVEGTLNYNSTTGAYSLTFINDNFYNSASCNLSPSCADTFFSCYYCYVNENLIPSNTNCTSGYAVEIKYNTGRVVDPLSGNELGLGIGIVIKFYSPKANPKQIKMLIYKKNEL